MDLQSRTWWLPAVVSATVLAGSATAAAQHREVPAESLIYDLKNPDPVRRQAAVHDLGIAKYTAAIPELVALAHDPSASVRRELELSLEQMENIATLPGFVELSSDFERDIRERAVQALINVHLPRASGPMAMLARLEDFITGASDQAVDIVVEPDVTIAPTVVPALRARVVDPETAIRRRAVRGLGILRAQAAVPDLIEVVRADRDDTIRFEAARALRKIRDTSAGESLLALVSVNNDKVRSEIIATIGLLRYRGAVSELTRMVEQSKESDPLRVLALAALADIADPASAPLFLSLKTDKHESVRLFANEGFARTADRTAKPTISGARLVEKSPRVRTAQAFGLSRIGEGEYLDELVRGLEKPATRELAREYLLETRPELRPALFTPRSANATVRAELADVFGLMGDPAALPALQDLARDSDTAVARAAARAMRRINASMTPSNSQ